MYLRNIAISNYHMFTYHPELILTKGMEFDTDPYTSNVNIIVGPNGSGKSNFLNLLTVLSDLHNAGNTPLSPLDKGAARRAGGLGESSGKGIKKHPGFESYPTTILAQRVIASAGDEHSITIQYDLDTMAYSIVDKGNAHIDLAKQQWNYNYYSIARSVQATNRDPQTTKLIKTYLGLIYNPFNQQYLTHHGSILHREDLGSGQQSIIWMINQIVRSKSIGGIVMIDEPELHLHPQYQKQLGLILEELSRTLNTQIVIATHSPFFLNDSNIQNVFRFTVHEGHTHMINPVDFAGQEGAKLKQILTDSNLAKLFFADMIIMVEGDTDEYFLSHYIQYYFTTHHLQAWSYNYEILNIAGKSSLRAWKSFCKQFDIQWSFIGDWDNVINSQFGTQIEPLKRQIPRFVHNHKLTKSEQYTALIELISDHYPTLEQQLNRWIDRQAHNHVYITRHGDLEAYLGLHDKGLDVTIEWCISQMSKRQQDAQFIPYRSDLDNILHKIFHVKSD